MKGIINESYWPNICLILTFSFSHLTQPFMSKINAQMVYTGKLAVVNDPELKRRVIAMVDYLSQFTLKPIHEGILSLLRKMPNDRTFTQDPYHN